jgi:hypothetical protein
MMATKAQNWWSRILTRLSGIYGPPILFAALALLILGPLLKPSYILTLDSPIAFNQDPWSHLTGLTSISTSVFGATDNSAPISLVLKFFDLFLPGWLVQKALLVSIFFLAAWGASRLPMLEGPGRYYCGVFYAVNPFTYIRFFSGQWGLLLGYALIPFALKTLLELLDAPDAKKGVRLALWATLIGLAQLHSLAIFLGIALVIVAAKLVWDRRAFISGALARAIGLGLVLFTILNLYWVVPSLSDAGSGGTVMGGFSESDRTLYQPRADSDFGVVFDVASLHGFWRGNYQYAGDFFSLWWLFFIASLFLTFLGLTARVDNRGKEWLPLAVAALGVVSFILGLGMATGVTSSIFEAAWDIVPGFSIFRDSHKFLAGLALAYAFLGALGLQELKRQMGGVGRGNGNGAWAGRALGLAVALPVVIALPIFGAAGQLETTRFPDDWQETRGVLREDKGDYNVLFLPWHMYFSNGWLPNDDKTLANPAPGYFGRNVLSGDNIEYGAYSQSSDPVSDYVEYLISKGNEVDNLGELLSPLNIRFVILAHESDYSQYGYLDRQADLEVVMKGERMSLYRNTHRTSPVYAVSRVHRIAGFDQLVEISREEDVSDSVFVLDSPDLPVALSTRGEEVASNFPDVKKNGETSYSVGTSEGRYLVLAGTHGATMRHWRKDGEQSVAVNLGMSPVFVNDGEASTIVFGRRTGMLIMESAALLAAVLGLAYITLPQKRLDRMTPSRWAFIKWPIRR